MQQPISEGSPARPLDPLRVEEWDFYAVPEAELVACCYWEYARESAFIRDVRRRCLDPAVRTMTNRQFWRHCGDDLERIQSIGEVSSVFLRGFFFAPDVVYQSTDEKAPHYRHPEAPPITGSFPEPWQSLAPAERICRAQIRTAGRVMPLAPFARGHSFMAEWIVEHRRRHQREVEGQGAAVERAHPGVSELVLPEQTQGPSPGPGSSLFLAGGSEVGLFQIQWDAFTNEELRDGFYHWLKANRPADLPGPDDRGHKRISWRVRLEQLAVLRLLHRFSLEELRLQQPPAWKRYASPNRRWQRDALKAGDSFRQLFPFLPPTDQPLSWPPTDRAG